MAAVLFGGHLVLALSFQGLRWEYLAVDGLLLATLALGPRGRRFSWLALPFWLTGIVYDNFRLVEHLRADVHVADLYHAELRWFGVGSGPDRQILPEFFAQHNWPAVDLVTGLAYILYLFWPIGLAIWFYFRDQRRMILLGWAFFGANLLGVATYLLWPAAPPWYVAEYGLGPAVLDAVPSAAGAARFDALTGTGWFAGFYGRSANVFGAMPSLHVAYPVIAVGVLRGLGARWVIPAGAFALLVAFSAVYLQHHYVWDVLFGAAYGAISLAVVAAVVRTYLMRGAAARARATAEEGVA